MHNVETLADFIRLHHRLKNTDHQRMGQRFVNMYVKGPMPDLFYEADDMKSVDKIMAWLTTYHYIDSDHSVNTLPPRLTN